jgi:hypothetical protein
MIEHISDMHLPSWDWSHLINVGSPLLRLQMMQNPSPSNVTITSMPRVCASEGWGYASPTMNARIENKIQNRTHTCDMAMNRKTYATIPWCGTPMSFQSSGSTNCSTPPRQRGPASGRGSPGDGPHREWCGGALKRRSPSCSFVCAPREGACVRTR